LYIPFFLFLPFVSSPFIFFSLVFSCSFSIFFVISRSPICDSSLCSWIHTWFCLYLWFFAAPSILLLLLSSP
jgi:hypothetical protein